MIRKENDQITIQFLGGKMAVGKFKLTYQDDSIAHGLAVQELATKLNPADDLSSFDTVETVGPRIMLAFRKKESVEVVIRQLQQLAERFEEKKDEQKL